MKKVNVCGQLFSQDLYSLFMTDFIDKFSYSSLSVESIFEELDDCEEKTHSLRNEKAYEFYQLLDEKKKREIDQFLERYTVFRGYQVGILAGKYDDSYTDKEIHRLFQKNFQYMLDDMRTILCFDSNGEFLKKQTFFNMGEMFRLSFEKNNASMMAYSMKKDYMDAFNYAISLDSIKAKDIIKINSIVNNSDPNKEIGFKKTDNMIVGAHFLVSSKETVPIKIQELLKEYDEDFGMEILNYNDPTISYQEKEKRLFQLFLKEAIFHIRLMRIHPFAEGNGRTGRIIMNKHLIENHLAPVLIDCNMSNKYKRCIEKCDYEGLAKMMLASSSQLLSSWVLAQEKGIVSKNFFITKEHLNVLIKIKSR